MLDIIKVQTVDGEKVNLDLNLVAEIRNEEKVIHLELFTGRTLTIEKTQKFLEALFHRTVTIEEAKKIIAARTKH